MQRITQQIQYKNLEVRLYLIAKATIANPNDPRKIKTNKNMANQVSSILKANLTKFSKRRTLHLIEMRVVFIYRKTQPF